MKSLVQLIHVLITIRLGVAHNINIGGRGGHRGQGPLIILNDTSYNFTAFGLNPSLSFYFFKGVIPPNALTLSTVSLLCMLIVHHDILC